jgi:hypothetical protein
MTAELQRAMASYEDARGRYRAAVLASLRGTASGDAIRRRVEIRDQGLGREPAGRVIARRTGLARRPWPRRSLRSVGLDSGGESSGEVSSRRTMVGGPTDRVSSSAWRHRGTDPGWCTAALSGTSGAAPTTSTPRSPAGVFASRRATRRSPRPTPSTRSSGRIPRPTWRAFAAVAQNGSVWMPRAGAARNAASRGRPRSADGTSAGFGRSTRQPSRALPSAAALVLSAVIGKSMAPGPRTRMPTTRGGPRSRRRGGAASDRTTPSLSKDRSRGAASNAGGALTSACTTPPRPRPEPISRKARLGAAPRALLEAGRGSPARPWQLDPGRARWLEVSAVQLSLRVTTPEGAMRFCSPER